MSLLYSKKLKLGSMGKVSTSKERGEIMNIDLILQKRQSGEQLGAHEIRALMLHALELLEYISEQTQASIARADDILEAQHQYKKAA